MKIWVLSDNIVGNTNQAIALAKELNQEFELIKLEYNCLKKTPNFILQYYPFHIKKSLLSSLNKNPLPQLVITSGRRTAPLALYLKRKSQGKIKLIQIMRPCIAYHKFDLVILPYHDKVRQEIKNIVRINGALTDITEKLPTAKAELHHDYPNLGKFLAVIIGGNNKSYTFSDEDALLLVSLLKKVQQYMQILLFISFSRRTPESVKNIIKHHLPTSTIIYDPMLEGNNPYVGMLASAEYIIVTADSISMCCDAMACGQPLYIFCSQNFTSKKHNAFTKQLLEQKIVRLFDASTIPLEKYYYIPVDEVKRIARIVEERFYFQQ